MKHIKTFEIVNQNKPKVGDYVIVRMPDASNNNGKQFINNNVGKIITIMSYNDKSLIQYNIDFKTCGFTKGHFQFLDDPDGQRYINNDYITHWSNNKEELELILQANKYNL